MGLRPTTLHENARSALDCGPAMRDRLEFRAKVRLRTDTALQGAFGTIIFRARNLALVVSSAIRLTAERDSSSVH